MTGRSRKASCSVAFEPSGRLGPAQPGQDLLSVARSFGVEIESVCGGKGSCGKCRVRIEPVGGKAEHAGASPVTEAEARLLGPESLAAGARLACQARITGDVSIFVPEESRRLGQVIRKEAGGRTVPVDPAVKSYRFRLQAPTAGDRRDEAARVLAALEQHCGLSGLEIDPGALGALPRALPGAESDLAAIVWRGGSAGGTVMDVRPAAELVRVLGLALDIGTTTIAAYLTDLSSGEVLATEPAMNPQVEFGDDVIARLYYASHHPDGPAELQRVVVAEVNSLAARTVERCGASLDDIFDVVMVGNTAMHHLFLGLETRTLAVAPFVPAVWGPTDLVASQLGLRFHPRCRLHALPVEAGFIGADNVGVLIAEEPYNQDEMLLIVDIGTNGELVLGDRRRLLSASCATGPALEGAHIEYGMRAAPGAIERVRIDPATLDVRFKVVGCEEWQADRPAGEVQARGICGSGIIEAAAEMLGAGVILPNGSFCPSLSHERVILEDGSPRKFVIARPEETVLGRSITVSLKDIRAVQLAKGALRAGAEVLLRAYGVARPDRVVLAGAFGSYIDKDHALAIGMLPDCDPEAVVSVGNAAGDGARFALLNLGKRREAEWVARKVEYVELAARPEFQTEFMRAMRFERPRPAQNRA